MPRTFSISSFVRDRTILPGEPITSEPSGIILFSGMNVFAPIRQFFPILALKFVKSKRNNSGHTGKDKDVEVEVELEVELERF